MNEKGAQRREWVKTAAIIFLSVLLVLTFFSNTIMNYSLPEVSAQYVQSGTITAKIRGTGVIESDDPYEVKIDSSRTIESVKVHAGDTVEKGDVLFTLTDEEDENLKQAKEELETALKTYDLAVKNLELNFLIGNIPEDVYNNMENGKVTTFADYRQQMLDAEAKIEEYQKSVTELTKAQDNLKYVTPDTSAEEKAYYEAEKKYDEKNSTLQEKEADLSALKADLKEAKELVNNVNKGYVTVSGGDAEKQLEIAKKKINDLPDEIKELEEKVDTLSDQVYDAKVNMDKKKDALDAKESNSGSEKSISLELADKQAKYDEAVAARDKIIEKIQVEYGTTYDLDTPYEAVLDAREKVSELEAKSIGATVNAPISGTIASVEVVAGDKAEAKEVLATMQPEGRGYTMSFSVTNEQAKRLSVGDKADLINAWRYDDVSVTLASIKPDKTEPGQKKLLTFNVSGEVTAGQTLNVSVGQKSAEYDLIVPNSAIREDNNGKFVLIVESKSSPLGNRYVATRVDVQVIASDDTKSAISGGLYGYEFVITTSTQPVEAGKLVRLADN